MNILYIAYSCDPYNGSEDKMGWNIPLECSKVGNKVIVITKEEQRDNIEKYCDENIVNNISFYYIDIPNILKKIFKGPLYSGRLKVWNKYVLNRIKDICKSEEIQIIHQITPIEFRAIGKYYNIENIKYVVGPLGGGSYVPKYLYNYLGKQKILEVIRLGLNAYFKQKLKWNRSLQKCDYVFYSNEETRDFLDYENKNKIITEIGVDSNEIIDRIKTIREGEKIRFLVVGRLVRIKGHNLLLDALERIPNHLDYNLDIIGDGKDYEILNSRINKSPYLSKHVRLLGKIPYTKMNSIYSNYDVLIMPSIRENTGTVILEAISNGLPVIAMNKFGAKVIINDDNGWLYDGKCKDDILENIKDILFQCITNYDLVNLKKNNALKSSKQYTWEKKINYYNKIYENQMNKSL